MRKGRVLTALVFLVVGLLCLIWWLTGRNDSSSIIRGVTNRTRSSLVSTRNRVAHQRDPGLVREERAAPLPKEAKPSAPSSFVVKDLFDESTIAGAVVRLASLESRIRSSKRSKPEEAQRCFTSDERGRFTVTGYSPYYYFESVQPERLVVCAVNRQNDAESKDSYEVWGYRPVVVDGIVSFETSGSGSFDQVKVEFLPSPLPEQQGVQNSARGSFLWAQQSRALFPSGRVDERGRFQIFVPRMNQITVVATCPGYYGARARLNAETSNTLSLVLRKSQTVTVRVRDTSGNPIVGARVQPYSSWRPRWEEFNFEDQKAFSTILGTGFAGWENPKTRTAGVDSGEAAGKTDVNGELVVTWTMEGEHVFLVSKEGLPARYFRGDEPIILAPPDPFPSRYVLRHAGRDLGGARVNQLTWKTGTMFTPVVLPAMAKLTLDKEGSLDSSLVVKHQPYGIYMELRDGTRLDGAVTFGDDEEVNVLLPPYPQPEK